MGVRELKLRTADRKAAGLIPQSAPMLNNNVGDHTPAAYYLLNLPNETGKLQASLEEWQKTGLPPLKVFAGIDGETLERPEPSKPKGKGWVGCRDGHVAILKDALANNYPSVFVFEDDMTLRQNFTEKFQSLLKALPNDADALFIGGEHKQVPLACPIPGMWKAMHTVRTHAYGVMNQNYMQYLIELWTDCRDHVDKVWAAQMSKHKVYASKEWLVGQRRGRSNNNGMTWQERWWNYKPTAEQLMVSIGQKSGCRGCGKRKPA